MGHWPRGPAGSGRSTMRRRRAAAVCEEGAGGGGGAAATPLERRGGWWVAVPRGDEALGVFGETRARRHRRNGGDVAITDGRQARPGRGVGDVIAAVAVDETVI